jgi:hypothetical protein
MSSDGPFRVENEMIPRERKKIKFTKLLFAVHFRFKVLIKDESTSVMGGCESELEDGAEDSMSGKF